MTSIISAGGPSLLDLPPEIRVRIYDYAIPEEIVLQTWDFHANIDERIYSMQLPEQEQPKFIFANKLIQQEASVIFWDRVTLDHSFLCADGKSLDDETQVSRIRVSEQDAASAQKLIISTEANCVPERLWPCEFPSLKFVDIRYLPSDIHERELQQYYFRARNLRDTKNVSTIVRGFFHNRVRWEGLSKNLSMDLPAILEENKYNISVVVTPVHVHQCWSIDHWSGVMKESRHDATALLKYDCNADVLTCDFVDAETRTNEFQDTILPGTIGPTRDSGKDQVRQMYRMTEEVIRVKNMKLLERLICREIEDRGMVPALSALPGRVAGHV